MSDTFAGFPSVMGNLVLKPSGWTLYTHGDIEFLARERERIRANTKQEVLFGRQFKFLNNYDYFFVQSDDGRELPRVFVRVCFATSILKQHPLTFHELVGNQLVEEFRRVIADFRDVAEGWVLWRRGESP